MSSIPLTDDQPTTYTTTELIRDIAKYIHPYRGRFWVGTSFRLVSELTFTASPYLYSKMITLVMGGASLSATYVFWALWGAAFFVRVWGQRLGRYFANRVAERATIDVQLAGLDQLVNWSLVAHEAEDSGNKIKRIQKGAAGVDKILRLLQDQWIAIVSHISTMLIVVTFTSWKIGLFLAVFLITYYLISHPRLARAGRLARLVNKQEEEVSGLIFEVLNNVRTTKVMHLYPWLKKRLRGMTDELYTRIVRRITAYQKTGTLVSTYAQTVRMLFVGAIIYGVATKHFEAGFLLLFISYFNNLRDSTEQLSEGTEEFGIAKHNLARFRDVAVVAATNPEAGTQTFPADWREIAIKNVSFAYGANEVLTNLSLTIRRGERLGIVGLSGTGKSTLFKLLLKEHQHFSGDILFDGVSIRTINPNSYAAHTAVVLQDTEVFNLSLKDNIMLGGPEASDATERLEKALTVSHVREFLPKLPHGVDTLIGEKGVKLSGGEKQRLGIARAIFKQPQLLFLDEATSHLDLESEEKIQDSLHTFFQQVTAVVIAHRLTTIREMDRILVLEGGEIIEAGTFDALMKKRGRFRELWEKQRL